MMRVLVLAVPILLASGCQTPSAVSAPTLAELDPATLPPRAATLAFDKTEVPVTLQASEGDPDLVLQWVAYGEVLETERYRRTQDSFMLVEALKETYDPPLVLAGSGSEKGWEGTLASAGVSRRATASISWKPERLDVLGKPAQAHVARVDMMIGDDPATAIERTLTFWFVKGQGIVQRQFGAWSTRTPRAEEPAP